MRLADRFPVMYLLECREARARERPTSVWSSAVVGSIVMSLPGLLMVSCFDPRHVWPVMLWTVAALIFMCCPLAALRDARLLASMRDGRFYESLVTCGESPFRIVAGIFLFSMRRAIRGCSLFYVLLLAGVFGFQSDPVYRFVAVLWLPSVLLAISMLSVLGLAVALWRSGQTERSVPTLTRLPWIRPWNNNAIVMRETSRQSARVASSVIKIVLLCATIALAFMGELLIAAGLLLVFALIQPLRAAWATVGSLSLEREKGTLEVLQQTPLTAAEFADGWASVGHRPRLLEMLLIAPILIGVTLIVDPVFLLFVIPGLIMLAMCIVIASYAGILISNQSSGRGDSYRNVTLTFAALALLLGYFVTMPFVGPGIAFFLLAGAVRDSRRAAITSLIRRGFAA